jgi:hypothetical protein
MNFREKIFYMSCIFRGTWWSSAAKDGRNSRKRPERSGKVIPAVFKLDIKTDLGIILNSVCGRKMLGFINSLLEILKWRVRNLTPPLVCSVSQIKVINSCGQPPIWEWPLL